MLWKISQGLLLTTSSLLISCSSPSPISQSPDSPSPTRQNQPTAKITQIETTGNPENYTFQVTVQSPDTGCEQYADWWEVVSENGKLIHRRVLLHSHVEEQPFTRSSSPVAIQPNQPVTVRVHMNNTGYSPQAMQGTVQEGFTSVQLPENFAASLADENPLPENCAF